MFTAHIFTKNKSLCNFNISVGDYLTRIKKKSLAQLEVKIFFLYSLIVYFLTLGVEISAATSVILELPNCNKSKRERLVYKSENYFLVNHIHGMKV